MTASGRRLAVAAALLAAALGGGCAREGAGERVLELALKTAPNRLDPALAVDVAEGEICALLFQGLVRYGPDGRLQPDLARTWEIDAAGTRYTFHLDARARFAGGRRVSAADVVYSFARVLSPRSASPRPWVLDRIRGAGAFGRGEAPEVEGLRAADDSTLVLELDAPFKPFLGMLALPAAMVVPRDAIGDDPAATFDGLPVGSGPWRLEAWERADYLLLAPNPYHHRAARGLDGIRLRIIPEAFTRVAEFESGALDVLEIPNAEMRRFLDDPRRADMIQSRAELRVYYIGLNNREPRLADRRVRRALNMAVDVDALIAVLAGGEAVRAAGAVPPGLPGYEARAPYPYDPERARRLLAEAGYPEGFAVEIWQRESPEGNRVLEAVQGYLRAVGVDARLVRREWSAFKEAVSAGRVDAFYLDWFADYPDAENFLYPLFHSRNAGGGGNRSFFADATVDSLIDAASGTLDDDACHALYARIDARVHEEAPWIFLYFPKTFQLVSPRVQGYRLPTLYLGADYAGVTKTR